MRVAGNATEKLGICSERVAMRGRLPPVAALEEVEREDVLCFLDDRGVEDVEVLGGKGWKEGLAEFELDPELGAAGVGDFDHLSGVRLGEVANFGWGGAGIAVIGHTVVVIGGRAQG